MRIINKKSFGMKVRELRLYDSGIELRNDSSIQSMFSTLMHKPEV